MSLMVGEVRLHRLAGRSRSAVGLPSCAPQNVAMSRAWLSSQSALKATCPGSESFPPSPIGGLKSCRLVADWWESIRWASLAALALTWTLNPSIVGTVGGQKCTALVRSYTKWRHSLSVEKCLFIIAFNGSRATRRQMGTARASRWSRMSVMTSRSASAGSRLSSRGIIDFIGRPSQSFRAGRTAMAGTLWTKGSHA